MPFYRWRVLETKSTPKRAKTRNNSKNLEKIRYGAFSDLVQW